MDLYRAQIGKRRAVFGSLPLIRAEVIDALQYAGTPPSKISLERVLSGGRREPADRQLKQIIDSYIVGAR